MRCPTVLDRSTAPKRRGSHAAAERMLRNSFRSTAKMDTLRPKALTRPLGHWLPHFEHYPFIGSLSGVDRPAGASALTRQQSECCGILLRLSKGRSKAKCAVGH